MGIFKKKKPVTTTLQIPNEIKVCQLYKGKQNKYGTFVLDTYWLCSKGDMYTIDNIGPEFSILGINWNGKNIINNVISSTDTVSSGKSKKTGRVIGAAIGTIIAPGLGTVIGAAHGTGNKKNDSNSKSTTYTHHIFKEEVSDIELTVRYNDGKEEFLEFQCYEEQAIILLSLMDEEVQHNKISDPYEEIKKLKELVDIGIITQEEFDTKKKQLLGL